MTITTVQGRAKLRPRSSPYWHKLSSKRHVGYRKLSRGSEGTWLAQAYDDATRKQVRRSLGAFDDLPPSQRFDAAVAAARALFEHLDLGGGTVSYTVKGACQAYVGYLNQTRTASAKDADARFRRWVYGDRFGQIVLVRLTERHVRSWRSSLAARPVTIDPHARKPRTRDRSPASINRDMTALRAALNYARKERAVASDMAWRYALAPFKNATRKRDVYLDRQERRELERCAAPDLARFLRGLSVVPVRPGALSKLQVADFDARLSVITVRQDKTARERKIKLPASAAAFFASQCRNKTPAAPIFSRADGKPWNKDSWKKPLRQAVASAGLPCGITAYALRHSVITDLVTGGLDLLTVSQMSGTSVLMIEQHYGHYRADHAAAALAGLME